MKKSHIVIIIFIVVAIGVVISLFMNISTYSNFTKAARKSFIAEPNLRILRNPPSWL